MILISDSGKIIRMRVDEISLLHRSTQGVRLIGLDEGERFVGLARAEREEEGGSLEDVPNDNGPDMEEEQPEEVV